MDSQIPEFVPRQRQPYIAPVATEPPPPRTRDSNTLQPVNVQLKIVGNKVQLKLNCLTQDVHDKYFFKGLKPPLMEYIRALARAGYSEDKIQRVVDSYQKWESSEYLQKIQDDIDRIWPGSKLKKTKTAVKKVLKAVKKL